MNEQFTPLKPVIVVLNDDNKASTFLNKVRTLNAVLSAVILVATVVNLCKLQVKVGKDLTEKENTQTESQGE